MGFIPAMPDVGWIAAWGINAMAAMINARQAERLKRCCVVAPCILSLLNYRNVLWPCEPPASADLETLARRGIKPKILFLVYK